jgi:hypothetical protein
MLAVDLIAWTQHLLLRGDLAKAEPKTRLPTAARRGAAHPQPTPPLAADPAVLALGHRTCRRVHRLATLPVPTG